MPRFFCPQPLAIGALVTLPDTVAHHIQVLRLALGEPVTLFNGEGGEYTARLTEISRRSVGVEVVAHDAREAELPFGITLAQALPEGSKMDWIVEKAVELGVTAFQPLAAQRCVVRLSAERAEKRLAHWRGIVEAAAEQSGRNRVAAVAPLQDYKQWIAGRAQGQGQGHGHGHGAGPRILLSPRAGQSLADWLRTQPPQDVTLMIGPEGGFSDAEETAALAAGATALSIGPRILRTETAGLAAIAMISALWGGI